VPECRVVYVDYDPQVILHARALLTSTPQGTTAYIEADLRDTGKILAEAAATLDFTRPVAVTLLAVLHCIEEADDPHGIVARLRDALAPGSYLVISHVTTEDIGAEAARQAREVYRQAGTPGGVRTRDQIQRFFDGLEMIPPGLVNVARWRPEPGAGAGSRTVFLAGAGRKISTATQDGRR
jgi:hypothetical protein